MKRTEEISQPGSHSGEEAGLALGNLAGLWGAACLQADLITVLP